MISEADLLVTFAEVAAAIAGFSAIAAAIGRTQAVEFGALLFVVLVSLSLVVICMLPLVVSQYPVSQLAVWRISSAIVLVLSIPVAYLQFRQLSAWGIDRGTRRQFRIRFLLYPLEIIVNVVLLMIVFGILAEFAGALYVTIVLLTTIEVAASFIWLLIRAFGPSAG